MSLPLTLAGVDAAVAVYLLTLGLRRQRRDKPAFLVVAVALAVCAVFLLVVGWPHPSGQMPQVGPPPGTPV